MAKKVKKGDPKVRQLKEVKITAKAPKKADSKSATSYGEVKTSKIDSVRKANPSAGKAIGTPYRDSGGMLRYGREASDVIRKTVKKGK